MHAAPSPPAIDDGSVDGGRKGGQSNETGASPHADEPDRPPRHVIRFLVLVGAAMVCLVLVALVVV